MDSGDRERLILETAAELFREKGFHGAGMDEIGTRAGLSGPALYRTFGGKNEILAALFTEALDELVGATTELLPDPVADLRRLVHHHVTFTVGRRALVAVYQREDRALVEPWRRDFDRRRRRYVERWEAAVARAVPAASPVEVEAATQGCLGTIFSLAVWPRRTLRSPGAVDAAEAYVLRGLGLPEGPGA
ncbi:TetR/AcrR family transcriptional regulator [Pseudonocardia sp. RS11V-5]|uniref:TetR/AcrR family transcriptional regulator n=1 Tax=Pseudonocardia terrae TaxID=2905831 RepID=UPI001E28A575|nr:TetR/AcrR family transcriptional regulator [Pseudonocardia terrae]MCE3551162.1 TetR/AcrR family transcriptional regulator [Pseudonocardia terrae]